MRKMFLVLLIFSVVGGAVSALDLTSFPDVIEPGDILVSPTFSFGSYYGYNMAIAITGAVDYALGTPVPLTVGAEAGIAMIPGYADAFTSLPIFVRLAYHPDMGVENLDTYATIKLGYNVLLTGDKVSGYGYSAKYGGGMAYGGNVGARYFFSPKMAVFGELGYDQYGISYEYSITGYGSAKYSYYIYTWFHAGVTIKF